MRQFARLIGLTGMVLGGWCAPQAHAAPTRYALASGVSHVRFVAHATLHAFEGETTAVRGEMTFDPMTNQLAEPVQVAIAVKAMRTGIAARDRALCRMFEADQYPELLLTVDSVTPLDLVEGTAARRYRLAGRLRIRRIERPVAFETQATVSGDGIEASGRVPLTTTMFDLKPPSVFGVIRVRPDIMVEFISRWTRQR